MAPSNPGSDSVSSPKTRLLPRRGERTVGTVIGRIELSRQKSTSCCMVSSEMTYAHAASDAVGRSPWKNCTLRRTVVEVWRGGDLPNPPQDLDGVCCSQMAEAVPSRFMLCNAWVLINVCGEPVSKRTTQPSCTATVPLWIFILVIKEELSIITTATRQGPCSASKGGC